MLKTKNYVKILEKRASADGKKSTEKAEPIISKQVGKQKVKDSDLLYVPLLANNKTSQ